MGRNSTENQSTLYIPALYVKSLVPTTARVKFKSICKLKQQSRMTTHVIRTRLKQKVVVLNVIIEIYLVSLFNPLFNDYETVALKLDRSKKLKKKARYTLRYNAAPLFSNLEHLLRRETPADAL